MVEDRTNPVKGSALRHRAEVLKELNLTLSPEHRAKLNAAGISDEVIADRGYFTVLTPWHLGMLGVQAAKPPVLVIPEYSVAGDEVRLTIRPDHPADPKRKYIGEAKPMRIMASPAVIRAIREAR